MIEAVDILSQLPVEDEQVLCTGACLGPWLGDFQPGCTEGESQRFSGRGHCPSHARKSNRQERLLFPKDPDQTQSLHQG